MNIDRVEFFVLDCLSELRAPESFFVSENRDLLFNRPMSDFNVADISKAIDFLSKNELIDAKKRLQEESEISIESKNGVEKILGLTLKGGQVWEKITRPDWSLYYWSYWKSSEELDADEMELVLQAERLEVLEDFYLKNLDLISERNPCNPNLIPIKDWKPRYWKQSRDAFELSVNFNAQIEPSNLYFPPDQEWTQLWERIDPIFKKDSKIKI